jgi:hypothetical protein
MTWGWLLACWLCLLAGFIFGAWWATHAQRSESLQVALYIDHLEEEVTQLKRKVEWERKRADREGIT